MKTTFVPTQIDDLRRTKTRHFLLAAGVAMFAAVLLAGLDVPAAPAPTADRPQAAIGAQIVSQSHPADLLVYIVGSRAEKDALDRDVSFRERLSEPGPAGFSIVKTRAIVIEPGSEESLGVLSDLVPEARITTDGGPRLTLVDTRR